MIDNILGVAMGIAVGALILFKADQQFVALLSGRLQRLGHDKELADLLYFQSTRLPARRLAALGMGLIALGFWAWTEEHFGAVVAVPGGLLVIAAGWDRLRAFVSAVEKVDGASQ